MFVFYQQQYLGDDLVSKMVASVVVLSKAVIMLTVYLLSVVAPIECLGLYLGSLLRVVVISDLLCCILAVVWLSVLRVSSSP